MDTSEQVAMESYEELEFIIGSDESHPLHFKNIKSNPNVSRPVSSYVDLVAYIKSRADFKDELEKATLKARNTPAQLILNDIMVTQANISHCDKSITILDEDKENKVFHYSNRNNFWAGICQTPCKLCKSFNLKHSKKLK